MPPSTTAWDQRAARARELAASHAEATHVLEFYAALMVFQRQVAQTLGADLPRAATTDPRAVASSTSIVELVGRHRIDAAVAGLLRWLRGRAPALLAEDISRLERCQPAEWAAFADAHWSARGMTTADGDEQMRFIVEAALHPFSELVRDDGLFDSTAPRHATCPGCGGHPVCGALREEAQGARRTLVCGLCLGEWTFRRLVCPACGEQRFEALAVYTTPEFPHLRLEICHTCGTYLKSVDLSKNGRAVPLVDDIASITLDLWARGQGHHKIRPNALRL